jgi:hypothetical protein
MFFALQIDHGSITQAVSETFLQDLGLDTNGERISHCINFQATERRRECLTGHADFNLGNTIFQVAFIVAELPSQLISKKMGPDRWTPLLMTAWSVVAVSQAALTGKNGFLITRALLGLLVVGYTLLSRVRS